MERRRARGRNKQRRWPAHQCMARTLVSIATMIATHVRVPCHETFIPGSTRHRIVAEHARVLYEPRARPTKYTVLYK